MRSFRKFIPFSKNHSIHLFNQSSEPTFRSLVSQDLNSKRLVASSFLHLHKFHTTAFTADKSNDALVVRGLKEMKLEQVPIPEDVKPTDVMVKVNFCGLCGTDMHVYEEGGIGAMRVDKSKPFVLGHESSATVLKVGSEVTHLKVGDRVAIEPAVPCCNCHWCLKGMYNLCDYCNKKARGLPPNDGCLQRYTVHPANFCFKLPKNVSLEEGALVEPISCALYGVQRAGVKVGDNILIVGAGPIGLISLVCAKAYGAQKICIADKNEQRLELAKELGADYTVVVNKDDTPQKLAAEIEKAAGKVDITLECSGSQRGTHAAILASKFGAKIAIVGIGPEVITIPVCELLFRQVDMLGVNKFVNNMELVIDLIATGKINVKPIITHKFLLEDWKSAFDTVKKQKGSKILIEL